MILAQDSAVISVNGECPNMPALVTRIETGPNSLRTLANACSTAARSVTSAPTPMAVTPAARRSSVTRCAACSLTSRTATRCPRRPSSWQVASPMPEAPPVTTETLFTRTPPVPCAWSVLETCSSTLDVVFEQLVAGALFDHPAQQFTQGLLLVGAQYAEHLLVSGPGVIDPPGNDVAS